MNSWVLSVQQWSQVLILSFAVLDKLELFGLNQKMKELELDSIVEHREELLISSQENDLVLEAVHFLKLDGPMLFVLLLVDKN